MKTYTTPLGPDEKELFVGRTRELEITERLLLKGLNCGIASSPGMGKSSFVNRVSRDLAQDMNVIALKIPAADHAYFFKRMLYELTSGDGGAPGLRERLLYTQEVETMFRFLVNGNTRSHAEEGKALDLLAAVLKKGFGKDRHILSTHEMRNASKNILKDMDRPTLVIVDDLDKGLSGKDKNGTVRRMVDFFMEVSDLFLTEKVSWLVTLPEAAAVSYADLEEDESKTQILSVINDIVELKPYSPEEFVNLLENRLGGDPGKYLDDPAARLSVALSKGNPRTLMYILTRVFSSSDEKAGVDRVLDVIGPSLGVDTKSLFILKRAAEEPYITAGDAAIKSATSLDSASVSIRMSDLAGRNLLLPDYMDKQKIFRLPYVHGRSIVKREARP